MRQIKTIITHKITTSEIISLTEEHDAKVNNQLKNISSKYVILNVGNTRIVEVANQNTKESQERITLTTTIQWDTGTRQ